MRCAGRRNQLWLVTQQLAGNEHLVEYGAVERAALVVTFPSCAKDGPGARNWRYLQQFGNFVVAPNMSAESERPARKTEKKPVRPGTEQTDITANEIYKFARDHIRLHKNVFVAAAQVVAHKALGMFKFAAIHVRRNDLQFKSSFLAADAMLKNIRKLLIRGEPLYISTDETDPDFFKAMKAEFDVIMWSDFFNENGENDASRRFQIKASQLPGGHVERRLEGLTEMAICSMARIFIGTPSSTFTAYIRRLRGYVHAPDTGFYDHTRYNEGSVAPPVIHSFFYDNPIIWEAINTLDDVV
eukprot:m.38482 g.38482  ORF g.38482 m.38482 type:complete len:299 (-) comp17928_c0_seq1:57-953(-)